MALNFSPAVGSIDEPPASVKTRGSDKAARTSKVLHSPPDACNRALCPQFLIQAPPGFIERIGMNSIKEGNAKKLPSVINTLAYLLERLDRSSVAVGAEQYLSVVQHLSEELGNAPTDDVLQNVLDEHPATAELYENLNYRHAGLCRSPLDISLAAELKAKDVIERARTASRSASHTASPQEKRTPPHDQA
jgi:hypothetical protein